MHEPLYSVEEMRAAEARYPGYPDTAGELMERAGRAVADECIRAYPEARRFAVVCGGGANGGDGRVATGLLRQAGREAVETDDLAGADVVVDALFGTGFRGEPRPEAAAMVCEWVSDTSISRMPTRSAQRSVRPASVTPGFGGPTISISFHVNSTPQPSAFPTRPAS